MFSSLIFSNSSRRICVLKCKLIIATCIHTHVQEGHRHISKTNAVMEKNPRKHDLIIIVGTIE